MLKKSLSVFAGLVLSLAVFAAGVELKDNHPDHYVVQKGDTLWDIAGHFLQKPWRWQEIWRANPQIKNPHWIYPGDELVLAYDANGAYLSHANSAIEPHARATPLDETIKPLPLSSIKQFLNKTRLLSGDEFEHAAHVVSIEEHLDRGVTGQLIYVRGLEAKPGQQFAIARAVGRYYDKPLKKGLREVYRQPIDDRDNRRGALWHHTPADITLHGMKHFLGYEMMEFGTVQVTRSGNPSSALITYSDYEVQPGDYILPIENNAYDNEYLPHPPKQAPDGMRVLAFSDALAAVGPTQVVALSRGKADGVENGQVYAVYQLGEQVTDKTDYPEGSMRAFAHPKKSQVQLPEEYTGHVMVFRTFDRISYGLVMDAVKPIRLESHLYSPDKTP